jgi:phosphoribosyl 1,2-cyclic phosphodiesterase
MSLKVKLWGVRGSLPAPHSPQQIEEKLRRCLNLYARLSPPPDIESFLSSLTPVEKGGYGGHTLCAEVFSPSTHLIVDGGSGLRALGEQALLGPAGMGKAEIHIFLTHFHWDHLIGLPFFIPLFIAGNKVNFYAVQEDLEPQIRGIFRKPNFPVPFEELKAGISFHRLAPRKPVRVGDIEVTPYQLDHPDPCWGYKFVHEGRSYSHCVDSECTRLSRQELGEDLALYHKADLVLFDAQYSFLEATRRLHWGHGSAPIGIDLALREGVKKILFVHHDPGASDEKIFDIRQQTLHYFEVIESQMRAAGEKPSPLQWEFAHEGMLIEVGK